MLTAVRESKEGGDIMVKRAWWFLLIIVCLLLCGACSGQDGNPLVGGMWTDQDTGISLEFKSDGKLHYIQSGDMLYDLWLGYEIKGDKIIVTYEPGTTEDLPFSINGEELTVTWESGNSSKLRRAASP